ncbi:hypothetical protein PIB30_007754 [Stylosanthes scabra]|uniref:Uncharacterized protein n=1 Tax=Stylosanthes scabra TaxID=79078 RepID=A0ABU6Y4Z8_9FABA|nr:hypothetical protein [Stylosanthes scabra]
MGQARPFDSPTPHRELGRAPTQSEEFVRTHTKKKDQGQFVDTRSKQFVEAVKAKMKRLEDERAARIAAGEPAVDPEDASTCNGPEAREHITLLNREIHQHADEYKREMEAWKQRYEIDVTRLQTTIDTQSAEFDQWKSHVSQMYAFMQSVHGTSSFVMPPPPPPSSSSLRPPRPPPAAAPSCIETHPDDESSSDDEEYD